MIFSALTPNTEPWNGGRSAYSMPNNKWLNKVPVFCKEIIYNHCCGNIFCVEVFNSYGKNLRCQHVTVRDKAVASY